MNVFVINEKDMAGSEEQAASEVVLLLREGEKVIFILSDEIPAAQLVSLLKKIGAEKRFLSERDFHLLSFAAQTSKSFRLASRLSDAGFSSAFSHAFFRAGNFSGKCDTVDIFINYREIEDLIAAHQVLILCPISVGEKSFSDGNGCREIEGSTALSSVMAVRDVTGFELTFEDGSQKIMLNVLNGIRTADISLDMINLCYGELFFICKPSSQKQIAAILEGLNCSFKVLKNLSKLSFSGVGIKGSVGIMDSIYRAFESRGIDILRTTDSHTTISCLINRENLDESLAFAKEELLIPETGIFIE